MNEFESEKDKNEIKIQNLSKKLEKTLEHNRQMLLTQSKLTTGGEQNRNQSQGNFHAGGQYKTEESQHPQHYTDYSDINNNQIPSSVRTGQHKKTAGASNSFNQSQSSVVKAARHLANVSVSQIQQQYALPGDKSKQAMRSQSVLKSHTEFNHNFGTQNTTGSLGSNSTQRAMNNYMLAPGSKGTHKGQGPHANNITKTVRNSKHIRSKNLVNVSDKMINVPVNQLKGQGGHTFEQPDQNPYIVDSFSTQLLSHSTAPENVSKHKHSLTQSNANLAAYSNMIDSSLVAE